MLSDAPSMFKKILIANRGEIACRIISTAQRMGIATVAIYSEADRRSVHVEMADEAVRVGGPASSESYLNVKAIMEAIRDTGVDAVHPGYGFLSENAAFAQNLKREGVTFIGPSPKAITAMGDKIESKRLASKAGVHIVPGQDGEIIDVQAAIRAAKQIGYPVMLKASAGGGGKGMRIAHDEASVQEGFKAAAREANASFGDGRIFIEKFIEEPRHIEIQILADSHGNTLYLAERECSIQRRHQKVIEESPSTFLDEDTRRAMGEQAVLLARAVDYTSAGTVEFIVDPMRNFYFLEMNTRLQVEHPVTEFITGLDLVEQMIRIAAGERLDMRQEDIVPKGWSIEARVYAENPARNFLPSIGRLVRYLPPIATKNVRIDTGVCEGGEISVFYDPMMAKVITHGSDRAEAICRMSVALDSFVIEGVVSNLNFLSNLMNHPRFLDGRLSTGFIATEYPEGFHPEKTASLMPTRITAIAAAIHSSHEMRSTTISRQTSYRTVSLRTEWVVIDGNTRRTVRVVTVEGGWDITVADSEVVRIRSEWQVGQGVFTANVNGKTMVVKIGRDCMVYLLTYAGVVSQLQVLSPTIAKLFDRMPEKRGVDRSHLVLSPMPGLLVSLSVILGQEVRAGEALAVVEAMKMENVLLAERDGVVAKLLAVPGETLTIDQPILEFNSNNSDS
jgi:propionyl-CoA carboxylase alpha chain